MLSAFAAYITGNVASNLVGRLISASLADHFGLAANFYILAGLNLAGAALVYVTIKGAPPSLSLPATQSARLASWLEHLRNPPVVAGFGIGYFNSVCRFHQHLHIRQLRAGEAAPQPRHDVGRGCLLRVSPLDRSNPIGGEGGSPVRTRATFWAAMASRARAPASCHTKSYAVLAGMVLIGVGTFFAQAIATGFVSRAATVIAVLRAACISPAIFRRRLTGSAVLGQVFDRWGWTACVAGSGYRCCRRGTCGDAPVPSVTAMGSEQCNLTRS